MKKTKLLKNAKGFTLIELMMVIVIIGVLVAIALPNFQTFVSKAKQAEAKTQLSLSYTSAEAFIQEFMSYIACATQIGLGPPRPANMANYAVGVPDDMASTSTCGVGVTGFSNCNALNFDDANPTCANGAGNGFYYAAAIDGDGQTAGMSIVTVLTGTGWTGAQINQTMFIAFAEGHIAAGMVVATQVDEWSINQNKTLAQLQSGI